MVKKISFQVLQGYKNPKKQKKKKTKAVDFPFSIVHVGSPIEISGELELFEG